MADVKISALPAATLPLTGAELAPIVQGGVTKKVAVNALASKLTSDTTFYVATTGNDSNAGTAISPWLTLQHAADVLGGYDLNGYDARIQLSDGEYDWAAFVTPVNSRANTTGFVATYWSTVGFSTLFIQGNSDDPTAVVLKSLTSGTLLSFLGGDTVAFALKNLTVDYRTPAINSAIIAAWNAVIFMGDGTGGTLRFLGQTTTGTQGDIFNSYSNCYTVLSDTIYADGHFDFGFIVGHGNYVYDFANISFGPDAQFVNFISLTDGAQFLADASAASFTGTFVGGRFSVDGVASSVDLRSIGGSSLTTIPGSLAGGVTGGGSYLSATAVLRDFAHLPTADPSALGEMFTVGAPSTGVPKALMVSGG